MKVSVVLFGLFVFFLTACQSKPFSDNTYFKNISVFYGKIYLDTYTIQESAFFLSNTNVVMLSNLNIVKSNQQTNSMQTNRTTNFILTVTNIFNPMNITKEQREKYLEDLRAEGEMYVSVIEKTVRGTLKTNSSEYITVTENFKKRYNDFQKYSHDLNGFELNDYKKQYRDIIESINKKLSMVTIIDEVDDQDWERWLKGYEAIVDKYLEYVKGLEKVTMEYTNDSKYKKIMETYHQLMEEGSIFQIELKGTNKEAFITGFDRISKKLYGEALPTADRDGDTLSTQSGVKTLQEAVPESLYYLKDLYFKDDYDN